MISNHYRASVCPAAIQERCVPFGAFSYKACFVMRCTLTLFPQSESNEWHLFALTRHSRLPMKSDLRENGVQNSSTLTRPLRLYDYDTRTARVRRDA